MSNWDKIPPVLETMDTTSNTSNMTVSKTGGLRDNKGKPKLSLVPKSLLVAVATVIWKNSIPGGGKYPMYNWEKGLPWTDVADSLLRHIFAWLGGENIDPESGIHHLWLAACNLAFLIQYQDICPQLDNRKKKDEHST